MALLRPEYNAAQNQYHELKSKWNSLLRERENIERSTFLSYLNVGQIYTFSRGERLNGIYYFTGDKVEIIRKSVKSITVKWLGDRKTDSKSVKVKDGVITHRIEISGLYDTFRYTPEFSQFQKFLNREESLKQLGL